MESKPGYKTTEFWLSLATILVGAVMASGVLDSLGTEHWLVKVVGIVMSVLGALGYSTSRAFVKNSDNKLAAVVAASSANPQKPPQ